MPAPVSSGSSPVEGRAVVLGGSIAGLLTAQVLARRFAGVIVVDRDDLDVADPAWADGMPPGRRGVPQIRQVHGLLVGGLQAIEELLPGYTEEVEAEGGILGDPVASVRWVVQGAPAVSCDFGLRGMLASRALLEHGIRARVLATPGVQALGGHDIVDLLATPDRRIVTGVRLARRSDATMPGGIETIDLTADLVVDATGRGSRAPVWLQQLGYEAPPETVVDVNLAYVTRYFLDRPGELGDLDTLNGKVITTTPPVPFTGVTLRQEGGHWVVTLGGLFGERPPTDLDAFASYAEARGFPEGARIATRCEPVSDALTYRFPDSRWRHWEKLARCPERFLVIGDAVCSFNPVYGQGMSSAALQARALASLLDRRPAASAGGLPPGLEREAARAFAAVVAVPWSMATGIDLRFPGQPRKPLPERILDRYLDRLLRTAHHDAEVATAFFRVLNLVARPPSLFAPSVVRRVLRPVHGDASASAPESGGHRPRRPPQRRRAA